MDTSYRRLAPGLRAVRLRQHPNLRPALARHAERQRDPVRPAAANLIPRWAGIRAGQAATIGDTGADDRARLSKRIGSARQRFRKLVLSARRLLWLRLRLRLAFNRRPSTVTRVVWS